VEGLLDLDPEDVDALVDRLKKSPGKKFRRALEALAIDAPPPGDAAGAGPKSIPEAVPPDKPCSSFLQGVAAAACRALLALVPELVGGAPPPRRPSSPGGPAAGAAAPAVAVLMPPPEVEAVLGLALAAMARYPAAAEVHLYANLLLAELGREEVWRERLCALGPGAPHSCEAVLLASLRGAHARGTAVHSLEASLRAVRRVVVGYFMMGTESVTEIPLQFYSFHLRFLS
jgi:hypothetical protein